MPVLMVLPTDPQEVAVLVRAVDYHLHLRGGVCVVRGGVPATEGFDLLWEGNEDLSTVREEELRLLKLGLSTAAATVGRGGVCGCYEGGGKVRGGGWVDRCACHLFFFCFFFSPFPFLFSLSLRFLHALDEQYAADLLLPILPVDIGLDGVVAAVAANALR